MYVNDGSGQFKRSLYYIDNYQINSAAVAVADFDTDGWQDIFIGGRSIPGIFGLSAKNVLLKNDLGINFVQVMNNPQNDILKTGMNTDAHWADLDSNGYPDLVLVGKWAPITIFWNDGTSMTKEEIEGTVGLWNSIFIDDLDADGKLDMLCGNMGLNHSLIGDSATTLNVYINDFDNDKSLDPVMTYVKNGREYTLRHKDVLVQQINKLRKKNLSYSEFANSSLDAIFDKDKLIKSFVKRINLFSSVALFNRGNHRFDVVALPRQLQAAPVYAFIDLPGLERKTILAGGNNYDVVPFVGRQDASRGWIMNFDKGFKVIPKTQTGLNLKGQIRKFLLLDRTEKELKILVVRNDDKASILSYRMDK